jgi:hypothetical protein
MITLWFICTAFVAQNNTCYAEEPFVSQTSCEMARIERFSPFAGPPGRFDKARQMQMRHLFRCEPRDVQKDRDNDRD